MRETIVGAAILLQVFPYQLGCVHCAGVVLSAGFLCMDDGGLTRYSGVMVLIIYGNSEIGAHVRSNLCYLICLRHSFRHQYDFS